MIHALILLASLATGQARHTRPAPPGNSDYAERFRLTDGTLNLDLLTSAPVADTGQKAIPVRIISSLSVPVTGTFYPATQPVSGTVGVTGTFWQATQPISGSVSVSSAPTTAVSESGVWTVQPGNTANTTAWKVDGSAVTQPVSGAFYQATQPVSGTVTANAGSGTMAVSGPVTDTQLRASAVPVSGTFFQGTQPVSIASMPSTPVTGAFYQVTQPVSLASAPTTAVTNAGLSNIDVALSTRTKPTDQQHAIIDSSASIAVTGPLTDTALRATPVPVSGTVTASGPATDAQLRATPLPVSGTVAATIASMPSTPVTGVFFQATQPVSGTVAVTGANTSQGQDYSGTARTMATDGSGVQYVARVNQPQPLNPFLQRCNLVRRTNCQP